MQGKLKLIILLWIPNVMELCIPAVKGPTQPAKASLYLIHVVLTSLHVAPHSAFFNQVSYSCSRSVTLECLVICWMRTIMFLEEEWSQSNGQPQRYIKSVE